MKLRHSHRAGKLAHCHQIMPSREHPTHFYKYCTADVAKLVLANSRLRWNSPLNFNDPFDCYFSVSPKFIGPEMAVRVREQALEILTQEDEPEFDPDSEVAPMLKLMRSKTAGQPRLLVDSLIGHLFDEWGEHFERIAAAEATYWLEVVAGYRVLCVCEINDNLLLWTHYTQNHSGVAFQLECLAELDVPLLAARKVKYATVAPSMATDDEWLAFAAGKGRRKVGGGTWHDLVTTKAKVWEYEQEWRVVDAGKGNKICGYDDCPFDPKEISKVFLGCKMNPTDRSVLLSLLTGQFAHVEAWQAMQDRRQYKLNFHRIK